MSIGSVLLLSACTTAIGPTAGEGGRRAEQQDDWTTEVTARIRDASRAFEPVTTGFAAEILERRIHGTFESTGVTLAFGEDSIGVSTVSWGRGAHFEPAQPVAPALGGCTDGLRDPAGDCVRRLEYPDVDRVEWWVGGEVGFQQGWRVDSRMGGSGELVIDLAVTGADVTGDDTGLWLQGDAGGALVVDGLGAWDADGEPLDVHFTPTYGGFRIHVADAHARYPITIDPVYTTPSWQVEGAEADDFGSAVGGAGDVNGDGYDDVIVGAPATDLSTGYAYVFLGSSSGVSSTADVTLVGGAAGSMFGEHVAGVGDVNGDGYDDVIVGAIGYNEYRGRASVFLGSASGVSTTPDTTLDGASSSDYLGTAVAAAGDVNNDGYDDVIVGAGGYLDVVGQAYVFHGSASGVSATATTTMTGEAAENYLGWTGSLSGAGDVNNDGYDDIIVGAAGYDAFSGRAYVHHGSASGVSSVASLIVTGSSSAALGSVVSGAGDVDDDGYDDVLIGARGYDTFTGRAYVHHGSSGGVSSTPALTLTGTTTNERFGDALAGPGDVDNDGYDDVAIGASGYDSGTGRVQVYHGSGSGVSGTATSTLTGSEEYESFATIDGAGDVNNDGYRDLIIGGSYARASVFHGSPGGVGTSADTTLNGIRYPDGLGISVSGAGDVDNDGYDDVIVGASQYLGQTGRAYVYAGSSSGLSTTADTTITGSAEGDGLGYAVSDAGDVDNDGYDDVLVGSAAGAAVYLGSSSGVSSSASATLACTGGCALSGAGDVNGDGYDDVIVGALASPEAYLYHGSGSGVSSTVATTLSGSTDFGVAVSDAGDVNNDGYGDVIVGASGVASIFHGSSSGVATTAATVTDEPAGDGTNRTVSAAGDVNNDGYDDVIVGAPTPNRYATYSSRVFIYLGSAAGISATEDTNMEGGLLYGAAVSGAGDVDNDGYADVIVGAPPSYGGSGAAYVYLGSAAGLDTTVASSLTIGETDYDDFGATVSGAGDVNNDGYDDVIVGAPSDSASAGRAYEFDGYGSTASADDDGDGYDSTADCNDSDAAIHPGATEVCDAGNVDEDCDSLADDDDASVDAATKSVTVYGDGDGDGYGAGAAQAFCDAPSSGTSAANSDCNDSDAAYNPGAAEACDGLDHDCDGLVDDDDPDVTGTSPWYADTDGDGHGDATNVTSACVAPVGGVASSDDCLDTDATVYPGASEICNGIDDDCDSLTDDDDPDVTGTSPWYADTDGDGHGDPTVSTTSCFAPLGYVADAADCNDASADYHPDAPEADCADPADYNCDGSTGFADADGDGFAACHECDDVSAAVNPAAVEVCNTIDDDCDGTIDIGAVDATTWYSDADGDGYTNPGDSRIACQAPLGYAAASADDDCDDADAQANPSGDEIPDDGIDQDCSGADATIAETDSGDSDGGSSTDEKVCSCDGGGAAGLLVLGSAVLAYRLRRRDTQVR